MRPWGARSLSLPPRGRLGPTLKPSRTRGAFPGPRLSSVKDLYLPGCPPVPKSTFNQKSKETQKERETAGQSSDEFSSSRTSRAFSSSSRQWVASWPVCFIVCRHQDPCQLRLSLGADPPHVGPRPVGSRRLMVLTPKIPPSYLPTTEQKNAFRPLRHPQPSPRSCP